MPPQRQHRILGSTHWQSLRCQEQRNQSALAAIPHFDPCLRKNSIIWLLRRNKIFPPNIPATDTTNHSLPDEFFTSESSTLLEQITSYLSETALILDTALCDLKRDIDGQPLQKKHISAADTKKANKHKAEKTTACTCKPPLTIPTDNARSAVALQ
jgi:hypothetical protein